MIVLAYYAVARASMRPGPIRPGDTTGSGCTLTARDALQ